VPGRNLSRTENRRATSRHCSVEPWALGLLLACCGLARDRLRTPSPGGDPALQRGPREPGHALRRRRRRSDRGGTAEVREKRARGVPGLRPALPRLRATSVWRLHGDSSRGVRWTPGALPAFAGRFPGAPFRTGHAPFVMHPALHDGSRREVVGPRRIGRARPS